jgi:hypothetical protein
VKNYSPKKTIFSTDPNCFYPHGKDKSKISPSKIELKEKVINCLRTKYHRAYENGLSWIRFIVVYPATFSKQSQYIYKERVQPRRMGTADNLNGIYFSLFASYNFVCLSILISLVFINLSSK